MSESKVVQTLACLLTPDEKALKSEQLVQALGDVDALEDRKKSAADDFKRLLIAKDCDVRRLTREISTGIEFRDVACHEVMSFARGQADMVRDDTGEIVGTRTLRVEERQGRFALDGPGDEENDDDDEEDDAEEVQAH
jgi:hypothetical protein